MRNPIDGTFAGAGTHWAFYEDEDTSHENHPVNVYLPYDFMNAEQRKKLSGEVKTYYIRVNKE